MKARQKWDLLVLNSKDFVNFVMSNLRNSEKFYTLRNVKKIHIFYMEINVKNSDLNPSVMCTSKSET